MNVSESVVWSKVICHTKGWTKSSFGRRLKTNGLIYIVRKTLGSKKTKFYRRRETVYYSKMSYWLFIYLNIHTYFINHITKQHIMQNIDNYDTSINNKS